MRCMESLTNLLHGISNQLFVSRYQLYLPDREQLERELQNILLEDNEK